MTWPSAVHIVGIKVSIELRRCCDIMESGLTTLDISLQPTFSDLNLGGCIFCFSGSFQSATENVTARSWLVQNFHFPGYPVVMGDSSLDLSFCLWCTVSFAEQLVETTVSPGFIGYMKREHLRELLGVLARAKGDSYS